MSARDRTSYEALEDAGLRAVAAMHEFANHIPQTQPRAAEPTNVVSFNAARARLQK